MATKTILIAQRVESDARMSVYIGYTTSTIEEIAACAHEMQR